MGGVYSRDFSRWWWWSVFPTGGQGGVPPPAVNLLIPPPNQKNPPHTHQIFIPLPPQVNFSPTKQQFSSYNPINSIFSCSHCSCSFLVLNSYSLDTQVMLILIDVQHSRKAAFSFEKGLNWQNHSSSGSLHLVKKYLSPPPYSKISDSPPPLTTIQKTLVVLVIGGGGMNKFSISGVVLPILTIREKPGPLQRSMKI